MDDKIVEVKNLTSAIEIGYRSRHVVEHVIIEYVARLTITEALIIFTIENRSDVRRVTLFPR